ncbi:MAG: zinc ribbon domain-containing protein [Candidatus Baldrarchaeia archaeon]
MLAFKAERAGRRVVRVKPANTSKRCANCGYVVKDLYLRDRWFICPNCGWEADRDLNASLTS